MIRSPIELHTRRYGNKQQDVSAAVSPHRQVQTAGVDIPVFQLFAQLAQGSSEPKEENR